MQPVQWYWFKYLNASTASAVTPHKHATLISNSNGINVSSNALKMKI